MCEGDGSEPPSSPPEKRAAERVPVMWSVDCETEETFLYAAITNISELGIFVATTDPLPVGTELTLKFAPEGEPEAEAFVLKGRVQWVNELRPNGDNLNPGMGVQFVGLAREDRERLVSVIKTIAYLRTDPRILH